MSRGEKFQLNKCILERFILMKFVLFIYIFFSFQILKAFICILLPGSQEPTTIFSITILVVIVANGKIKFVSSITDISLQFLHLRGQENKYVVKQLKKKDLRKLSKNCKDKITQKSENYHKQSDFLFGPCLKSLKETVRNRCLSVVIKIRGFAVFKELSELQENFV